MSMVNQLVVIFEILEELEHKDTAELKVSDLQKCSVVVTIARFQMSFSQLACQSHTAHQSILVTKSFIGKHNISKTL